MQDQVTFTTPVGRHTVVIKGWMTGRDELAIQQAVQEQMKVTFGEGNTPSMEANVAVLNAGQNKALELMLVSVDGKTDDAVNAVLDMRAEDYRYVKEQIDKVTQPMDEQKKSDSQDKPSAPGAAAQG